MFVALVVRYRYICGRLGDLCAFLENLCHEEDLATEPEHMGIPLHWQYQAHQHMEVEGMADEGGKEEEILLGVQARHVGPALDSPEKKHGGRGRGGKVEWSGQVGCLDKARSGLEAVGR